MVMVGGIFLDWLLRFIIIIFYEKIFIKVKCCKVFINVFFMKNNLN